MSDEAPQILLRLPIDELVTNLPEYLSEQELLDFISALIYEAEDKHEGFTEKLIEEL